MPNTVYENLVLAASPLMFWPLREDANDISGNARHGTVNGTWNFNQAVPAGGIGLVAGSTAGSTSFIVSPAVSWPAGAITVEAWYTYHGVVNEMAWAFSPNGSPLDDFHGNAAPGFNNGASNIYPNAAPSQALHHFVYVFTPGSQLSTAGKVYYDGVLQTLTGSSFIPTSLSGTTFRNSGWANDANYRRTAGRYASHYAIYAGELSASVIANHFTVGKFGNPMSDAFADAPTFTSEIIFITGSHSEEAGEPLTMPVAKTGWAKFVPAATRVHRLSTKSADFDAGLAVHTGSAVNALTTLATDNDSGPGDAAMLTVPMVAGRTYYVQVGSGTGTVNGTGTLAIEDIGIIAPTDAFADAPLIGVGPTLMDPPAGGTIALMSGGPAEYVVRTMIGGVATSPKITVDMIASMNNPGPTKQVVWRVRRDNLAGAIVMTSATLNATTDRSDGLDSGFRWTPAQYTDASPTTGTYVLTVQPVNHQSTVYVGGYSWAFVASALSHPSTSSFGTEASEPLVLPVAKTGWWRFTAPRDGRYTFSGVGCAFDAALAVYTGSALGALTLLGSDRNTGGTNSPLLSLDLVAGTAVYVQIGSGAGTAAGEVQLGITYASYVGAVQLAVYCDTVAQPVAATLLKGRATAVLDNLPGG